MPCLSEVGFSNTNELFIDHLREYESWMMSLSKQQIMWKNYLGGKTWFRVEIFLSDRECIVTET